MKKSTSSSSSSSGSSTTSGSSSCSGSSGSSSSDSDSSSSAEDKVVIVNGNGNFSKDPEVEPKPEIQPQVITRRKSAEFKAAAAVAAASLPVKANSVNGCPSQRLPPSEDETLPPRPTSFPVVLQRRKNSVHSTAHSASNDASTNSKGPQEKENKDQSNCTETGSLTGTLNDILTGTLTDALTGTLTDTHTGTITGTLTDTLTGTLTGTPTPALTGTHTPALTVTPTPALTGTPTAGLTDTVTGPVTSPVTAPITGKGGRRGQKVPVQNTTQPSTTEKFTKVKKPTRTKLQPRRKVASRAVNYRKSSADESESESGSVSPVRSSSSVSEATDSSNSFAARHLKATKGKRVPTAPKIPRSDSDEVNVINHEVTPRKFTRSFLTRQSKQQLKQSGAGTDTDSDALAELDIGKRLTTKSPAKKPVPPFGGITKCKAKKEGGCPILHSRPMMLSPPQLEKKCPIDACDSSGHLCGNLDKHFLPEACPIYHNLSASECKERANERKLRNEQQQQQDPNIFCFNSLSLDSSSSKTLTLEQKEFLTTIRESRTRFRPTSAAGSQDKVKLEKDCTDEDREPSLTGMVPDYDLQLFRDAQALASEKVEDSVKDMTVGKGIKYITMGKYRMKVWYQSPYPDDAARLPQMYICEFCLRYQKSQVGIKRHALKCVWRHPPGDEIYRKGKLQVWQVDGKRHKQYCQHLCLLAKFFLDHKTLYYDVEPFLFYIMTLADIDGCHTVGYFSKEKNSFYNVSCILTLPPYQRKGYGRLLIDFSYLLTKVEGKIGSPEKPLSDLGLISYRSYWKDVLLDYLCTRSGNTLSIKEVSQEMAIYSYDIVSTLQALGMMKYWKGKHIVLKKQDVLDEYEERVKRRGNFPKIDDTCLRWSPFIPTQTNDSL